MKPPPSPGAVRWAVLGIACAVLMAGMSGLRFRQQQASLERESALQAQGRQLFEGEASPLGTLPGRLAGHSDDLPAAATRCINCHTSGARTDAPSKTPEFAPRLNRQSLTQPTSRRGGPPSAYDVASLCKVLREGVDPAWVMVRQEMPHYAATDAQCVALWSFLVSAAPAQAHP